jgi:hypothetical protein
MPDYPGDDVHSHRRRFELYWALAQTLEKKFAARRLTVPIDGLSFFNAEEDRGDPPTR